MTDFYWLTLGVLAVWRLTHLLIYEDGPLKCFERFRRCVRKTYLAEAVNCFYCMSLIVSIPVALYLGHRVFEGVLLWLSCSAGAIMLERLGDLTHGGFGHEDLPEPVYWEDGTP